MPDRCTGPLVDELERELRARGDAERAVGAKAYLKSDLEFVGVASKPLRGVARSFLEAHPEVDHDILLEVVSALWERPIFELKAVAVALLEIWAMDLDVGDLEFMENLLRRSHTWALVDWLCTKVVAPVVESEPEMTRKVLIRWSRDDNFWLRRSSMLSLLPALRAGAGDFGLFASFASRMVGEKQFFIRKAIGWVLRDVSKKRPDLTHDFLLEHVNELSGLTLRVGSKYLSSDQKETVLQLHRSRSP